MYTLVNNIDRTGETTKTDIFGKKVVITVYSTMTLLIQGPGCRDWTNTVFKALSAHLSANDDSQNSQPSVDHHNSQTSECDSSTMKHKSKSFIHSIVKKLTVPRLFTDKKMKTKKNKRNIFVSTPIDHRNLGERQTSQDTDEQTNLKQIHTLSGSSHLNQTEDNSYLKHCFGSESRLSESGITVKSVSTETDEKSIADQEISNKAEKELQSLKKEIEELRKVKAETKKAKQHLIRKNVEQAQLLQGISTQHKIIDKSHFYIEEISSLKDSLKGIKHELADTRAQVLIIEEEKKTSNIKIKTFKKKRKNKSSKLQYIYNSI